MGAVAVGFVGFAGKGPGEASPERPMRTAEISTLHGFSQGGSF
jgi:hypothetical protein